MTRQLRIARNRSVLDSHLGRSGPRAQPPAGEARGRRRGSVFTPGIPLTTTVWNNWRSLSHVGKRCAQCTLSGQSGRSARERVAAEQRGESVSASRAVLRLVRGLVLLRRWRSATWVSALRGHPGQNGHLARRLVEVAVRGEREPAWQRVLWEVSSARDLATSRGSATRTSVPSGRSGQSGHRALAAVEEVRPLRGESVFFRGWWTASLDVRVSR